MSLTAEQEQLARTVDTMRANDELLTKLALAFKKAEAERDAYYQHLEVAQAEVQRLRDRVDELKSMIAQIVESTGCTTIVHCDEERGLYATLRRLGVYELADTFRRLPRVQAAEASANTTAAGAAPAPAAQAEDADDGRSEDRFSQNRE